MSNQTQVQVQTPAVPQTIHIWMFAAATISTVFVVPHAILAFKWHWPSTLANLHMLITLGFWLAGVVFVTRKSNADAPESNSSISEELVLTNRQREQLSEVDRLEVWLNMIDKER
ncbi:hypothetical protein [Amycolatopsis sp. NPDC051128]|uniref:hypothetical protein n=1 Tax=Amycolatopsis sp. NPDC051128 TaxID=3155412 RepID=UPI0034493047